MNIKSLYIELTNSCNLRCKHCYNASGLNNEVMPIDWFDSLLTDAVNMGIDSVSISGGEPFSVLSFGDYLHSISSHGIEYVSFITNGTLITEELIQIVKDNVKHPLYQISIDGVGEQHDALRGDGCYEKVVQSLDLLQKTSSNFFFHSVVHKNNYTHLDEIIKLALQYSVRNIDFSFIKRKGRGKDFYSSIQISSENRIQCIRDLLRLKDEYASSGLQINPPSVFYGRCPIYTGDDFNFDLSPRVDVYGTVYACQNIDCNCFELGNIKKRRLDDVLNEENIKRQRQYIASMKSNQQCENCFLNSFCGRGCPGLEYSDYLDILSEDCAERRNYALSILKDMMENNNAIDNKRDNN